MNQLATETLDVLRRVRACIDAGVGTWPSVLTGEIDDLIVKLESGTPEIGVSFEIPAGLREWCEWWNGLKARGLVASGVNPDKPSAGVTAGWKRVQRDRELQALLALRHRIGQRIEESALCREGWFRLEKLFGAKNKAGEFIVRCLLDGAYVVRNGNGHGQPTTMDSLRRFVEGGAA